MSDEGKRHVLLNAPGYRGHRADPSDIMVWCECGGSTGFEWHTIDKLAECAARTIQCIWCGKELVEIVHENFAPKQWVINRPE